MSDEKYFPGLEGVIAGETAISTITDGLRYRGYRVAQLADECRFEEVAYLILYGELPTAAELRAFSQRVNQASQLPPEIVATLASLPVTANFMDVMRTGASLLAHWDPDCGANDPAANLRKSERLLGQLPVVLAVRHRQRLGLAPVPARQDGSLAENILWMLTGEPASAAAIHAMDVSLILYAEHEFNASTFTARVVASTLSDLHSAITAAIGALKGPLHGGANERVLDVLQQVGTPDQAAGWIRQALDNKVKIMGFGHRVYKTGDPRATYLLKLCQALATRPEFAAMEQTAAVIEEVVVREKGLPPNLDWPSARLYYYLGLPVDLYTPLFVVSRVVGWSAHVSEQLSNNRIIRPRSRYIGPAERDLPARG